MAEILTVEQLEIRHANIRSMPSDIMMHAAHISLQSDALIHIASALEENNKLLDLMLEQLIKIRQQG